MTQTKDDLLNFMRRLRAVREYTAEEVTQATLEEILDVGRWSATGGNRQPHEVVVVRDHDVKQKFAEWGAKPAGPAAVALLIVTASDASAFDEGRVAERLALAAKACGLGSCIATLKTTAPMPPKSSSGSPSREARAHTGDPRPHRRRGPRALPKGRRPASRCLSLPIGTGTSVWKYLGPVEGIQKGPLYV